MLVKADNESQASDLVSINLERFKDWGYLKVGGQTMSASERILVG